MDLSGRRVEEALAALTRTGTPYAVDRVSGWEAALTVAARREHDVGLLGPRVGDRDGLELARAVRAAAPGLPVMLVTDGALAWPELDALAAGLHDLLILGEDVPEPAATRWLRSAVDGANSARELERARVDLQRERDEVETLARAVSHDLRGPLQVISGYVELLALRFRSHADERTLQAIDRVLRGVGQVNDRIEALLALARVQGFDAPTGPVDLGRAWDEAVVALADELRAARIVASRDPLPIVPGRHPLYARLFRELLGVVVRTHADVPGTVHATAAPMPGGVRVTLVDSGPGVDRRLIRRLFEPFGDATDSTALAICRKIVERHHGRVGYEPRDAGGAFWVVFPSR